jgi:hypothetical protein
MIQPVETSSIRFPNTVYTFNVKKYMEFQVTGKGGVHNHPCSHNLFFPQEIHTTQFYAASYHSRNPEHNTFDKIRSYQYFRRLYHLYFQGNFYPVVNNICILTHTCSIISRCSRMWVGLAQVRWNVGGTCGDTMEIVAKTFACKVQHLLMAGCKYLRLCKYEYII